MMNIQCKEKKKVVVDIICFIRWRNQWIMLNIHRQLIRVKQRSMIMKKKNIFERSSERFFTIGKSNVVVFFIDF